MKGGDSNQRENADKRTINRLNLQLNRNASTVPSTPPIPTFRSDKDRDKEPTSSSKIKLGRIKSLGKLDIKSPLISHGVTPGGSLSFHNDGGSLHTSRTQNSVISKLLNIVPETIYSMRNYYNDFTTIDWTDAFLKTNKFQYELYHKHWMVDHGSTDQEEVDLKIPFYYRLYLTLGKWFLIVLIGFVFSLVAYSIDKLEIVLVGFKHGYCSSNWLASQVSCCADFEKIGQFKGLPLHSPVLYRNVFKSGYVFNQNINSFESGCPDWITWDSYFNGYKLHQLVKLDFVIYVVLTIVLAYIACLITLSTKITGGYPIQSPPEKNSTDQVSGTSSDDENIDDEVDEEARSDSSEVSRSSDNLVSFEIKDNIQPKVMYTAAGSGVPEVKTILSGFVIRRFLGTYTFVAKTSALVLAIASGMSLGKEGPYVHLATAVGNILTRFFPFIANNELMQKQILSAAASSGVALAFGSPLGGVLFILEEINHSLPSHQLFQIFFCSIISTLFLKFLDPYGTGNSVLFELSYDSDWKPIELLFFIIIGLSGGVFGGYFVKFVGWWPKNFRQLKLIKNHPIFEVILIALITGIVTFWNPYTKQASSELVLDLATPCDGKQLDRSLCPNNNHQFVRELGSLLFALIVKTILTSITFGLKLPIGIYVPSMVIGALFGRLFATIIEFVNYSYNLNLNLIDNTSASTFSSFVGVVCGNGDKGCIDLGIYSMIGAGAFIAGVTRMNITLVIILFEITSSYTYVLPYSISIAVANWMGNYIESNSLYESLLIANDYPFMSPETEPIDPFKTAGEIIEESVVMEINDETPQHSTAQSNNEVTLPPPSESPFTLLNPHASYLQSQVPQTSPHITRNNTSFLQTRRQRSISSIIENRELSKLYIDITQSPYVLTQVLRSKLLILANKSMLDGCIALIKNKVCVGLIFFAELEFCLDKINEFCIQYDISEDIYCKVHNEESYLNGLNNVSIDNIRGPLKYNFNVIKNNINLDSREVDYFNYGSVQEDENNKRILFDLQTELIELSDLNNHISYNLIFLNYDSELSLAHLIFDKVGNRVIVLLKNGKYFGILHKKTLIDYIRRDEH